MRFKRFISSLMILPDPENIWIIPGLTRALREIRQNRISATLTSGPPYSAHLIGLIAKKLTGVIWIADFRDPWMTPLQDRLYLKSPLAVKIHQLLEKQVIAHADIVLTTTGILADHLKEAFSQCDSHKFQFIPNGYDPEKIPSDKRIEKYDRFTIAYTGVLYLGRSPEPIFTAIKQLANEGKITPKEINLKLVGQCDTIRGQSTHKIISDYGLEGVVELMGQVPYHEALEIIKKSHLALLLAPDQKLMIPAKVYDYIGCGTEILAIADDGATSQLVISTQTGKVFDSGDVAGIKRYLYESIQSKGVSRLKESASVTKFNRKNLVGTLAGILDSMTEGK